MLFNIQALRALAVVLVVFTHLDPVLATLGIPHIAGNGVDLFFVISGFIMVYTTAERRPTPDEFMRDRIIRIVPVYWLITLGVFLLVLVAPGFVGATSADPVQLIKSLLFIPFDKGNGLIQPTLFVGWSLNYEMAFYAVFALGLFIRPYWLGLTLTGAAILAAWLTGLWLEPASVAGRFYTHPIVLEFGMGMILGVVAPRLPKQVGIPGQILAFSVVILGIGTLVLFPMWSSDDYWPVAFACVFITAAALVLESAGRKVTFKPVLLVGAASYVIYLTHAFVTQAGQKAYAMIPHSPLIALALLVAVLGVVIAAGIAFHLVVERPLTKALKSWLHRPPPPTPSIVAPL